MFNVAQVDNFALPDMPTTSLVERDQAADAFFAATKADIRHGGERAFYHTREDFIQMPDERLFRGSQYGTPTEDYFCVLAHEATHWTSHATRLNRELGKRFGETIGDGAEQEAFIVWLEAAGFARARQIVVGERFVRPGCDCDLVALLPFDLHRRDTKEQRTGEVAA